MSDNNINENEEILEKEEEIEEQPIGETKSYDKVIEDARLDLFNSYSKSRRISNILMFAVVAAICGIMFMIISNNDVLRIIGYCLAGALILGMVLYYVLTRKNLPNKVKTYVPLVTKALNDKMFADSKFAGIETNEEEKLAMDDLVGDGVYVEANGINSRNVVRGTFKEHHFLYAEAALMRPSTRKQQVPPLFVGRYISVPNQMKFDGRIILVFKNPKQPLDLPNAISDLVALEDKEDFSVYGPEGTNYRSLIGNNVIDRLQKLQIEGHLLNVNVVFWGGHTAAYLSYDDTILSVPFDKPFDKDGFEKSLNDLLICFNAITEK